MARAPRQNTRAPTAGRRAGGSTTISASVATAVAKRLEAFVGRTHWNQSRVVANALELYTELPPVALQRMTELGDRLGEERLREAVAHAIERVIDRLEWEVVAADTARELEGRLPPDLSEEELVRGARTAIAASRTARRAARAVERETAPATAPAAARHPGPSRRR
jgi:hypothetical protein